MKKQIIFVVIVLLLNSRSSYCDVIPYFSHYVSKCIKITNIDDFPEVSLLGFIPPGTIKYDTYIISSSECLTKGYKYNYFYIFAVNNEYLTGKDIKTLDLPRDPNAITSNIYIEPYGRYFNDSIPISAIEQYYKILGFSETSVILHKWKEITKFNNGKPDSTQTFDYAGETANLYQKIQTGILSNSSNSNIELYPNPASKNIHFKLISSDQGSVSIEIVTLNGKIVKHLTLNKTGILLEYDLPLEDTSKGTYLVKVKSGTKVESKKIIIK